MKIFVITSRVPYPLEKGDKLRLFNQLKVLSKKHELILCALTDTDVHPKALEILMEFCAEVYIFKLSRWRILLNLILNFFNNTPFQVAYFYQKKIHKKVRHLIVNYKPDHIYCQLVRVSEYVKDEAVPKTLDYMDVFSKGIERRIPQQPFYLRFLFQMEYKRLKHYESEMLHYFDRTTVISIEEKAYLNEPTENNIEIIPNGIDKEYFHTINAEKKYDLLFTGNMNYEPNVDAAIYLVNEILPLLIHDFPDIRIMIAGAAPSKQVINLCSEHVEVSGWVDDLRIIYAASKILVAPMRLGTGMQNKLLEAMAMNIPCITSELANRGLAAAEGESVMIGRSAKEYARIIKELLTDQQKLSELANKGHDFVINTYDWNTSTNKLEKLMFIE